MMDLVLARGVMENARILEEFSNRVARGELCRFEFLGFFHLPPSPCSLAWWGPCLLDLE